MHGCIFGTAETKIHPVSEAIPNEISRELVQGMTVSKATEILSQFSNETCET